MMTDAMLKVSKSIFIDSKLSSCNHPNGPFVALKMFCLLGQDHIKTRINGLVLTYQFFWLCGK